MSSLRPGLPEPGRLRARRRGGCGASRGRRCRDRKDRPRGLLDRASQRSTTTLRELPYPSVMEKTLLPPAITHLSARADSPQLSMNGASHTPPHVTLRAGVPPPPARPAPRRRKHPPRPHAFAVSPPPRQNRPELARHRQPKRHPGLGLRHPEQPRREVHPLPPKRHDLTPAHSRVEPEPQEVATHGVCTAASIPALQHGSTSAGDDIRRLVLRW